jgi:hypothetical protein
MISEITYFTHNKFAQHRRIEKHDIKFSELTFLLSGDLVYYVNDVKHEIIGGDIIYVPQAVHVTTNVFEQMMSGNMPNMGTGMPNMGASRPSGNMGGMSGSRPSGNMGGGMR